MIKHYWRFIKSFKRRQHEQEKEEEKEDDVTVPATIDHPFRWHHDLLPERQGMSVCQQATRRVDGGARSASCQSIGKATIADECFHFGLSAHENPPAEARGCQLVGFFCQGYSHECRQPVPQGERLGLWRAWGGEFPGIHVQRRVACRAALYPRVPRRVDVYSRMAPPRDSRRGEGWRHADHGLFLRLPAGRATRALPACRDPRRRDGHVHATRSRGTGRGASFPGDGGAYLSLFQVPGRGGVHSFHLCARCAGGGGGAGVGKGPPGNVFTIRL